MRLQARKLAGATGPPVTVFVVEDHRLLRESTAAMLEAGGIAVVGTARSNEQALREIARLSSPPRIVLLDAGLDDSVEALTRLRRAAPETHVIAASFDPGQNALVRFIHAGAAGFILKDATAAEIVGTIHRVVDGGPALPRELGRLLYSHVASQSRNGGRRDVAAAARLTRREREVIALIADGLSNKEIASRLHVATHTVKAHVHGILEKLGLRTRLEIAAHVHAERR